MSNRQAFGRSASKPAIFAAALTVLGSLAALFIAGGVVGSGPILPSAEVLQAQGRGSVAGNVTDASGSPASLVTVRVGVKRAGTAEAGEDKPLSIGFEDNDPLDMQAKSEFRWVATTRTDAAGNFVLQAAAGKYTLQAVDQKRGRSQVEIEIRAGQQIRQDLRLDPNAQPGGGGGGKGK
jgi:hypothetical protein